MKRLEGRVAIVTGGGIGIGAAVCRRLAAEGARVVVGDIDDANSAEVAAGIKASGGDAISVNVDIGEEGNIARLIAAVDATYGRLDVLHNNAAATSSAQMAKDMGIVQMDAEIWDRAFDINARGTMLMIKHAIPLMLKHARGSIINTSSGAAQSGDLYGPAYAASKAAVECLTLYVATQYGKQGIRCNAVSPGLIETPTVKRVLTAEHRRRITTHKLTPYLGEPDDIAAAVAYLASDDARFVTAQVLNVNGGILNHMPYFAETLANFEADPGNRTV
jgi:NAD(P)-dependent dehydrogenase (short-subunit alcohol dehydrogenase family)